MDTTPTTTDADVEAARAKYPTNPAHTEVADMIMSVIRTLLTGRVTASNLLIPDIHKDDRIADGTLINLKKAARSAVAIACGDNKRDAVAIVTYAIEWNKTIAEVLAEVRSGEFDWKEWGVPAWVTDAEL